MRQLREWAEWGVLNIDLDIWRILCYYKNKEILVIYITKPCKLDLSQKGDKVRFLCVIVTMFCDLHIKRSALIPNFSVCQSF